MASDGLRPGPVRRSAGTWLVAAIRMPSTMLYDRRRRRSPPRQAQRWHHCDAYGVPGQISRDLVNSQVRAISVPVSPKQASVPGVGPRCYSLPEKFAAQVKSDLCHQGFEQR